MADAHPHPLPPEPTKSDIKLVIAASSAGTIFEWYDFFIYGALGVILSKTFFPTGNATLEMLLFWLVFAVGFGFRPLGAILFGYLGDKLGRKYTFLMTDSLMGVATAGVGMVPSADSIGYWAPAIVIFLRILQGLALGGEYGGAAIYVAEHSPPDQRGFYTGFIQSSVVGGFVLSLIVVLSCKAVMSAETWNDWGWRVPFLLSIALLVISLWMRVKLNESPVFRAMKEEGELAGNPFVESFTYPGNKKRLFIALFGVGAGLTAIWYCSMFYGLSFLKGQMRMEDTTAEIIVGLAALAGMAFYVLAGKLSDKVGRKKPIVLGYVAILVLLFPLFWWIGAAANPALNAANRDQAVVVAGPDCEYVWYAAEQETQCAKLLADLSGVGVAYSRAEASELSVTVGGKPLPLEQYAFDDKAARSAQLANWLGDAGYNLGKVTPTFQQGFMVFLGMFGLMLLSAITYGPVAALLTEMFPARIRYSSMSIPYHIGTGYFGGFLPFVSALIVALTGDPYSGLWYTWGVTAMALVVAWWGLKGGPPRDFEEAERA
jgi:MFS family permease